MALSVTDNTITGWGIGVALYQCQSGCSGATFTSIAVNNNSIVSNTQYGVYAAGLGGNADATNNWWGSSTGPAHASNPGGTGNAVSNGVDFDPWQGSVPSSVAPLSLQTTLDQATSGDTINLSPTLYEGGNTVDTSNLTINLNGATFGPGSPAFTVTADNVTISGPGTLDGGGSGSPAVLVTAGADNFTLSGVEVRGWEDGVQVEGSVNSLKLIGNFIHSNSDAAIQVDSGAAVGGVVTIEGNLFKDNGTGIRNDGATALQARRNSWGAIAGPSVGDTAGATAVNTSDFSFAELYIDVEPDTDASTRNVVENDAFDVAVKVDAAGLYAVQYRVSFDPALLQLNGVSDGAFKGSGACVTDTSTAGVVAGYCSRQAPDADAAGSGLTVATLSFTATGSGLTGDGPWTNHFDVSTSATQLVAGAQGGVNVYVNNGGFGAPETRDLLTGTEDGEIVITGLGNFTGFIDLQGRANDSGATMQALDQQAVAGSTALASGTSNAGGSYTTSYINPHQLTIGSTYYFQVNRPLYLPTTAVALTDWTHNGVLTTRPLTSLGTVVLLGGDATDDNQIDINDAACIGGQYGSNSPASCGGSGSADVNGDGRVDLLDLVLMGGNYGLNSSPWTP
jgi:hypothetical protein